MAFNVQTFKTRALSAVVFVIIMLVGLLWNHRSFFVLFSIIHFGCWIEYQKLVEKIDSDYANISPFHKYGVMLAGWGFMLWMTNDAYSLGNFSLKDAGFWMMVIGAIAVNAEVLFTRKFKLLAHSFLGLIYISLSLGLLVSMAEFFDAKSVIPGWGTEVNNPSLNTKQWREYGVLFPCFTVLSMWINDTMAYIVGSFMGKTQLSKISPKKTWEGTIGGVILCGLVMGYLAFMFDEWFVFGKTFFFWFVLAVIAAIFGTLGDLFESKLKRLAGVKDSGTMMPGHGGFLDRFDSLLVATPFVWLYVTLFI